MKTVLKSTASSEEEEIDRILGDRLLFEVTDPQKLGGPSVPVIFRADRAGLIKLIRTGKRTKLSRATMKLIMTKGLPPIPFLYGQQAVAAKEAAARKLSGKGKRA